MENVIWTDDLKKEVLRRVKWDRNTLRTIKRRKTKCFRHTYLLKHVIGRKIEVKRRKEDISSSWMISSKR